jgi:hypothetical protein
MNKKLSLTWISLIGLTVISALIANTSPSYAAFLIIALAGAKFLGIAFQFMELKKAHLFWKIVLSLFLSLFAICLLLLV